MELCSSVLHITYTNNSSPDFQREEHQLLSQKNKQTNKQDCAVQYYNNNNTKITQTSFAPPYQGNSVDREREREPTCVCNFQNFSPGLRAPTGVKRAQQPGAQELHRGQEIRQKRKRAVKTPYPQKEQESGIIYRSQCRHSAHRGSGTAWA